jgi:hypothetical protein
MKERCMYAEHCENMKLNCLVWAIHEGPCSFMRKTKKGMEEMGGCFTCRVREGWHVCIPVLTKNEKKKEF